jgi:hypothetical protein
MTWVRLDDNYFEHPKVAAVGDDAALLNLAAVCWCNRQLTDGLIPKGKVATLVHKRTAPLVKLLVTVHHPNKSPLWHDEGECYRIHDYLKYQDSKQKVLGKRESAKHRKNLAEVNGES